MLEEEPKKVWAFLLVLAIAVGPLFGQATPSVDQRNPKDVVSLREYMDIRFSSLEAKIDAANSMRQLAIDKAEAAVNLRLESMNEFRAQLKDQAGQFALKTEMETRGKEVDGKINAINEQFAGLNGGLKLFGSIIVLVNLGLALWGMRLRTIANRSDNVRQDKEVSSEARGE